MNQTGDSLNTNDRQNLHYRKLSPLWWVSDETVWVISVAVTVNSGRSESVDKFFKIDYLIIKSILCFFEVNLFADQ
jgi:hypothetical protein